MTVFCRIRWSKFLQLGPIHAWQFLTPAVATFFIYSWIDFRLIELITTVIKFSIQWGRKKFLVCRKKNSSYCIWSSFNKKIQFQQFHFRWKKSDVLVSWLFETQLGFEPGVFERKKMIGLFTTDSLLVGVRVNHWVFSSHWTELRQ